MLRFIVCMCMWSVVLSSEWYWPESQRILENTKSMETISKTYVINLKSRPEKLQNFRRQYPYDMKHVTIFEGIDGKTLDITQPNVSRHIRAMVGFEKHWNPGVLGCSLSHMAVWNLIASDKALSNDDRVMVFEDDPYFSKDFRRVWTSAAKELPKDADHVFVGGRFRPEYVPPKQSRHMECTMRDFKKVGQYVYTTPKGVFCFRTAVAYMLTKRGARRFLGAVEQHNGIRRGVDHFMMDHIKLQPKEEPTWSYNILPMPIYQKKDEITDIRQASNTWSVDKSGLDVLETLLREKKKPILWMGTDNIDNIPAYMFESWHNFTKGYQVRIYEEEQADTYVKLHCQGVWKLYSALKKYRTQPFRFDIWRTCALYTEGGFYMDIKTMLRQPLKSFVRPMVTTMTRGQRGGLAIGFMGGPAKQAIFAKFALEAKDHGPDLPHYHFYTVLMSDIAKRFSDIVYLNEDCSNYAGCVPDRHGLCCRIFDDNQQLMALTRDPTYPWRSSNGGLKHVVNLGNFYTLREKKKPILWMTTDNIDNIPAYMFESWHNFTNGYQVRIYDDEQVDTYVKLHCQGVWKLYSGLKKYRTQPFRFDIWRTCALYTEGGFYMDIKTMLRQPLKSFVRPMVTTMTRGQRGGLAIGFMGGPAKQAIFAKFALEAKDHGPDLPHYHFYTVLMSDIAKRFSDIVYLNEDCSNYAGCVPDRHGLCCRIFDDNQQLMALTRDPTYPWRSSNGGLKHVVNLGNFYTLRETHPSALVEVGALAPEQIVNGRRTWVTMTTLPERLSNPWFAKTLNRTITMCSRLGATLLLQVPPHTRHSSRPYMVPQYILNLQSAAFQVSRVNVDEGPITKILPALRDPRIKDDDTIVVCDDDIVYRENVFKWLSDSVKKHPNAVSCTCSRRIAGFKGFAFQKRVFKELANIRQPPSCFRIDDDVIREFARHRNIGRVAVPYNNDTWWTCSMYRGQTDTHPRWPELAHDDRTPMQDKCIREFQQELANQYTNG